MLCSRLVRQIAVVPLALVALGSAAACDRGGEADRQGEQAAATAPKSGEVVRDAAGEPAPDIVFTTLEGETASLADFEGQPVLVNLWATWCVPCVKELPALDRLDARHEEVKLLPISQDFGGAEAVRPFLAEQGLEDMESWLDPENRWLGPESGIDVLPTSIYFDAEGRDVWRVIGEIDWDAAKADALIAEGL